MIIISFVSDLTVRYVFWGVRFMHGPMSIACVLENHVVYVTANNGNSIAIVDVQDPSSPSVVGGVVDDAKLNNPRGITHDPSNKLLFVACYVGDSLTVVSVEDALSPVILGTVSDSTFMSGAQEVAAHPTEALVFVTGATSDSICVVDVSLPSNPIVVDGLVDSTLMNAAFGVVYDHVAKTVLVAGSTSHSLAAFSVVGTTALFPPSPEPTSFIFEGLVLASHIVDETTLGGSFGQIATDALRKIVFVTSQSSSSIAAYSYEDPGNLTLLGVSLSVDSMSGVRGVSYDDLHQVLLATSASSVLVVLTVEDPASIEVLGFVDKESDSPLESKGSCIDISKFTAFTFDSSVDGITAVSYANASYPVVLGEITDST